MYFTSIADREPNTAARLAALVVLVETEVDVQLSAVVFTKTVVELDATDVVLDEGLVVEVVLCTGIDK